MVVDEKRFNPFKPTSVIPENPPDIFEAVGTAQAETGGEKEEGAAVAPSDCTILDPSNVALTLIFWSAVNRSTQA